MAGIPGRPKKGRRFGGDAAHQKAKAIRYVYVGLLNDRIATVVITNSMINSLLRPNIVPSLPPTPSTSEIIPRHRDSSSEYRPAERNESAGQARGGAASPIVKTGGAQREPLPAVIIHRGKTRTAQLARALCATTWPRSTPADAAD